MVYSVWREQERKYYYYCSESPPRPRNLGRKVLALEDALPELPADARPTGRSGVRAVGTICVGPT